MKTLIFTLTFFWGLSVFAQESPRHFQYHAPGVTRISEADLIELNNTEWVIVERRFYMEDKPGAPTAYKYQLKFSETGSILSGDVVIGDWSVDRNRLLKITEKPDKSELPSIQFLGLFAVEWLEDDAFLLTKTLTTDFQNKVEYKLVPIDMFQENPSLLNFYPQKSSRSEDQLPYSPIRNKVKAEYFMRGMRLPENFNELKDSELQKLLDDLNKKQ
ncbi:MAG TPA: hypothetical protein PKE06_23195 [Flavilitoribacter sp.]|nr:hypothetical protein [Flavilitoribacter sp.]HMQ91425.1 hypothetical protein [Flavilitoribacter sp.]